MFGLSGQPVTIQPETRFNSCEASFPIHILSRMSYAQLWLLPVWPDISKCPREKYKKCITNRKRLRETNEQNSAFMICIVYGLVEFNWELY